MTITLQAVNELIQSLESAGELSIKERKYLELAREFKRLAAESVVLISSAECLLHEASEVYRAYNKTQLPDGDLVDGQSLQEVRDAINATPATDRIYAEAEARGVEKFALSRRELAKEAMSQIMPLALEAEAQRADDFAKQLREGAK
ncbi:TPA: hypothetical protein ACTZGK_002853 [Raoultella planticola]